jgi:hypothetical protein
MVVAVAKNPVVKISPRDRVTSLAEYFCQPLLVWIFQTWPYPRDNPMVVAPGAGMVPVGAQA